MYVVVKQGVYIKDVWGPFELARAKLVAQQMAAADEDSYHSWQVRELSQHEGLGWEPLAEYEKSAESAYGVWERAARAYKLMMDMAKPPVPAVGNNLRRHG